MIGLYANSAMSNYLQAVLDGSVCYLMTGDIPTEPVELNQNTILENSDNLLVENSVAVWHLKSINKIINESECRNYFAPLIKYNKGYLDLLDYTTFVPKYIKVISDIKVYFATHSLYSAMYGDARLTVGPQATPDGNHMTMEIGMPGSVSMLGFDIDVSNNDLVDYVAIEAYDGSTWSELKREPSFELGKIMLDAPTQAEKWRVVINCANAPRVYVSKFAPIVEPDSGSVQFDNQVITHAVIVKDTYDTNWPGTLATVMLEVGELGSGAELELSSTNFKYGDKLWNGKFGFNLEGLGNGNI